MSNFDHLKNMSREELVALSEQHNVPVHHKAKPETIIKNLLDATLQPVKQPATNNEDPRRTPKVAVFNTREQVEEMLKPIRAKVPEFLSAYDDEARAVTFSCKGRLETFNLSVPMHFLRACAYEISRGRLALMGADPKHFEPGTSTGKNAYTNVVLA